MTRGPGRSPRRSWWRPAPPARDPGTLWAAETLAPLGRQTVECEVTPRVMARIAADVVARPAVATWPRSSRLAWASSLLLACAALAFLGSTLLLLVRRGDEGVQEIVGLGQSSWHVLMVFGRLVADFGGSVLTFVLPILRAGLILLDVAAPLLRGAGLLAAAGGALSILFSAYVLASARKTAPEVNFQGGTR